MGKENDRPPAPGEVSAPVPPLWFAEVLGLQVPIDTYYLHRGRTWSRIGDDGQVTVGIDDFAQKVFGPADAVELPESGDISLQNHICLALLRAGRRAKFWAAAGPGIPLAGSKPAVEKALLSPAPAGAGGCPAFSQHNFTGKEA